MTRASSASKRRIALRKTLAVVTAALLCITMGGCAGSSATIDDEPTPLAETAGEDNSNAGGSQDGEAGGGSDDQEMPGNEEGSGTGSGESSNQSEGGDGSSGGTGSGSEGQSDEEQSGGSGEPNLVEQEISKIDRIVRLAAAGRVASVSTFEELKAAVDADAELIALNLTEAIKVDDCITVESGKNITITGGTLTRPKHSLSIFVVEEDATLNLENTVLSGDQTVEGKAAQSNGVSALLVDGKVIMGVNSVIEGFSAAKGGGVYIRSGELVMNEGSSITKNTAINGNQTYKDRDAYGGGVYIDHGKLVMNEGSEIRENLAKGDQLGNNGPQSNGGGIYISPSGKMVMNGGSVVGNKATIKGGGLCIGIDRERSSGQEITLNYGSIAENEAWTGGGFYLADKCTLIIKKAAIVENSADDGSGYGRGGGVWCCSTGGGLFYATNGCLLTRNKSNRQGADFTADPQLKSATSHHLPTYLSDGTKISWYQTGNNRGSWYYKSIGGNSIPNIDEYLRLSRGRDNMWGDPLGLTSLIEGSYQEDVYNLLITKNRAYADGGGVAMNGLLVMGEDKDISLTVNKVWEGIDEVAQPESIKVDLFKGDKNIDTLELTKENGWTYTVNGLPEGNDYRVEEQKIDGFNATYSEVALADAEKRAYEVTITNKSAGGDLRITKAWVDTTADNMAANGSATAIFRVTGYATQAEAEGGEGTEIYRNLVALTFNDPDTQERILTGLPVGFYVVEEVGYENDNLADDAVAANRTVVEVSATSTEPAEAAFTNRSSDEGTFGTSVVNTYEASPNNGIVFRNQDPLYRELHGAVA